MDNNVNFGGRGGEEITNQSAHTFWILVISITFIICLLDYSDILFTTI